jgi:protein TonB
MRCITMDFDAWTTSAGDPLRRRRLMIGYVVGVATISGLGAFIVLTSNKASAREDEEPVIEAQLAKEPEPEPPPEPVVAPKATAPKPPPPKPSVKTPVEVPQEPLKEAEANKAQLAEESDPFQRGESAEKPPEPTVVAPPPPPPPKPVLRPENKGPVRVTEDMTRPEAIGAQAKPDYPADARAQGIEGTVWVRYVVSEAGVVTDAKVVKGPPEFAAVCLAAVRGWRFKPALQADGKPVAVVQMARFPFKIKT